MSPVLRFYMLFETNIMSLDKTAQRLQRICRRTKARKTEIYQHIDSE